MAGKLQDCPFQSLRCIWPRKQKPDLPTLKQRTCPGATGASLDTQRYRKKDRHRDRSKLYTLAGLPSWTRTRPLASCASAMTRPRSLVTLAGRNKCLLLSSLCISLEACTASRGNHSSLPSAMRAGLVLSLVLGLVLHVSWAGRCKMISVCQFLPTCNSI